MTTLDPETRDELTRLDITPAQIAALEAALDDAANGHARMNADLALRILRVIMAAEAGEKQDKENHADSNQRR